MTPFQVTLHSLPTTHAFCHSHNAARAAIIFLHGLTAGPLRSSLTVTLAGKLPEDFALWELHMRSSFTGFGFSSLADDIADIAELVTYLHSLDVEKIVLMGTSTGCQDIMEYVSGDHQVPPVDGYILTCPVSDREFGEFALGAETLGASVAHAQEMIDGGKKDEIMPSGIIPPIFSSPVSAYRWHSLAAKGGDDDYFSSDLDEITLQQTFGKIDKPVLVLTAGKDELVPPTIDRDALIGRWKNTVVGDHWSSLSQSVPEADHQVLGRKEQEAFAAIVVAFLKNLEQ